MRPDKARKTLRVQYQVVLGGKAKHRSKYSKRKDVAAHLFQLAEILERCSKTGAPPTPAQITDILECQLISPEEMRRSFPYWSPGMTMAPAAQATDYDALLEAYEDYALRHSKAGDPARKTHQIHMNSAINAIKWMRQVAPDLRDLTPEMVLSWYDSRRASTSVQTANHSISRLRVLLDRAVELGMVLTNPSRDKSVSLRSAKPQRERIVLREEEAQALLKGSLEHREWLSGCLPTAVRMGLYAGLRNEEMAWMEWEAVDLKARSLAVRPTTCGVNGEKWQPKDEEVRTLDVKQVFADYLAEERHRQEQEGILGQFVLVAGNSRHTGYRGKPLSDGAVRQAMKKLMKALNMDPQVTPYCLRHTYATTLLRSGVDIRTVQARMGHSRITTTMGYLHYVSVGDHPTDKLPY